MKITSKNVFKTAVLALSALTIFGTAQAHHSFSIYDLDNPIEITGTLTSLKFRNPHTIFIVEQDGVEVEAVWTIESMNPRRWDSLVPTREVANEGDTVTIKGWPAVNGGKTMALGTVTSPLGVTVVRDEIRQGDRNERSNSGRSGMGR